MKHKHKNCRRCLTCSLCQCDVLIYCVAIVNIKPEIELQLCEGCAGKLKADWEARE